MRFADQLERQHLPMLRRLKKGEIGNFGGIEWRWSDGPENDGLGTVQGIAWFLREPAASLARYTSDPLSAPNKLVFRVRIRTGSFANGRNASVPSGPNPVSGT
ncbi:hypothetical protein GRI40_13220 [Altererythrobacter aerius]|uniref:Uncharacterized protein n=1 Tax=Tsuneonella aeria TaxID=1837929 RepID=A0A6I4TG82_9SPHN|nr:hypothetical protein [Tsuneonella aeria]MXO76173.1 hypothetical protein [Tsuneonella aeria]